MALAFAFYTDAQDTSGGAISQGDNDAEEAASL